MKSYYVKCRKNAKSLNSKIFNTKNGRLIMQSKCAECGIKRSRFEKEQQSVKMFFKCKNEWNCE